VERVTRREWVWAAAVAALTLALSSLPYAVGYLAQPPDRSFIGAVYDWEDTYSHLAKMQQGVRGDWEYRILFTPEEHPGAYINTFYIALGHLSRTLGLPPLLVYHLARLVCAVLLLATVYGFIGVFIPADRGGYGGSPLRRVAYLLACLSSGLGWLVLLLTRSYTLGGITPTDFWFIEMYTFFTVLTFPHTCLAQALHLLAFAAGVRLLREQGRRLDWPGAALAGLTLAVIHPYVLLPLYASLGLYALVHRLRHRAPPWRRLAGLLGLALLPLPVVAYSYQAISSNPVFSAWQAQSYTLSPPPVHYLLGYGVVLALAIWGGVRVVWEWAEPEMALVVWTLVVAPLLYAPLVFHLQRRMIDGLHVPLAILAALGLTQGLLPAVRRSRLAGWLARRGYPRPRLVALTGWLVVAFSTPSTWYLLASLILAAAGGYGPLYHSRAEVEAVHWLGEHSSPSDTVLCSYEICGYIPARIGQRTFWGHWAESIHLPQKQAAAQAFYSDLVTFDRAGMLAHYNIVYVFHGPREQRMGNFDPATAPYLKAAFQQDGVAIYRVLSEETP